MPWQGYNFEDSILISERLVKEDVFTSIHIEEFECVARDTKLGKEEITRDIPNVGEEALKDLDESGIIRIGAEVKPGDILVGKITPKGETQLSPEEKLLRAIFGEKAGDVRDSSLRVPPGVTGMVINAKVFSRKGVEKDERAKAIEEMEEAKLLKDQNDEIRIIQDSAYQKIRQAADRQGGHRPPGRRQAARSCSSSGEAIADEVLDAIPQRYWGEIAVEGDVADLVRKIIENFQEQQDLVKLLFGEKIGRLKKGDELPAGRHQDGEGLRRHQAQAGRSATRWPAATATRASSPASSPRRTCRTSRTARPVDIVLNPLGVPSRMNVGPDPRDPPRLGGPQRRPPAQRDAGEELRPQRAPQEAQEGLRRGARATATRRRWRSSTTCRRPSCPRLVQKLRNGVHVATPVFDGAREEEMRDLLVQGGATMQSVLFDGRTGEPFDQDVTVGVMYMLKLHHLVDDKIHARSIGPYSLVTQQPLGGKAQFGGQRLGEMEVWAMEAYGAAYALQEFLTVKSDDVVGRTRMYEAIVKGENTLESGLPESFNVLIKELQSLALDVELLESPEAKAQRELEAATAAADPLAPRPGGDKKTA